MKKPYLEFVRGLAAIIVLGYHCIELQFIISGFACILMITIVLEKHFQPAVAGHFKSTRKASALR